MADMERVRQLLAGVAATVVAALLVAACVGPDTTTASLSDDQDDTGTLPTATTTANTTTTNTTTNTGATSAASGSQDVDSEPPSSTTTIAPPLDPLLGLDTELIVAGFDQPVFATTAPGSELVYVVEREGLIRVVADGVIAPDPFLDLTDRLLSSSIEQGLLGLAFHPDFETNRLFYAYWTNVDGDSRLAQFAAPSPMAADVESMKSVLMVDQPAERHNAGMIEFGPDGLLYLSLGDGGDGGSEGQNTSTLLGSIVRLKVAPDGTYTVPEGNPFDDEIWHYGLRNPWRFSIDPDSRSIYIGDVGQDTFEEINVASLDDDGLNFGWFEKEGNRCFRAGCDEEGLTDPVLQYSHDEGCSITGGVVYRGKAIPEFHGHYFFGDWCGGFVRSMRLLDNRAVDQFDWSADLEAIGQITSFGTDDAGEIITVNWDGELHRIIPRR